MCLNTSQGFYQTLLSLPCTGGSTIRSRTHTRFPRLERFLRMCGENLGKLLGMKVFKALSDFSMFVQHGTKKLSCIFSPILQGYGKQLPQPTGSLPKRSECGEYPLTPPGKSFQAKRANGKLCTRECLLEPPRCSR